MDLEPNKIHHIPVRVTYTFSPQAITTQAPPYFSTGYGFPQLPSAPVESSYTATCSGLIPVFVHDTETSRSSLGSKGKKIENIGDRGDADHGEDHQRGSVCLKSLVKAICLSSPEIIPSRTTQDLKIYTHSTVKRHASSHPSQQRTTQNNLAHLASTPGLSSSLSRSSSAIPESETEPVQSSPWYSGRSAAYPETQPGQWMGMNMYGFTSPYLPPGGHHLPSSHSHIALNKSRGQAEQALQPKSTLASVLQEKGTGKTTVTGRLIPAGLHMLETVFEDLSSNDPLAMGVEALAARQLQHPISAFLDVELVLSAPITIDRSVQSNALLTLDKERAVYHTLGLEWGPGLSATNATDTRDSARSKPVVQVKPEPDWPSSSSGGITEDSLSTTESSSYSKKTTLPSGTPFRPFRPTSSKMALFEYQSRNRRRGMSTLREHQYTSDPNSGSPQNSPSNIFSRTRSRTRLGMGTTLEQVANVSNVVRLARKNPSALVDRFLSGRTATSPVKRRNNGSGFTIDEVPKVPKVTSTVKTLNIATGSSKKRKTVSVVIDEAGRPIRWGVGTNSPVKSVNAAPASMAILNQRSSQTNVKSEGRSDNNSSSIKKGPEARTLFGRNLPICSNCGITESNTWRTQGKGHRVCNACGLYWNTKGRVRPKELWEKDIARWNKRKAKAMASGANANPSSGTGRATTSVTPAPKDMTVKSERKPSTAGQLPSSSLKSVNTQTNTLNVPSGTGTPTGGSSLKRNLSAIAEKEAQLHADSRKNHLAKTRREQLMNDDRALPESANTVEGNKENLPTLMNSGNSLHPSPVVDLVNGFKRENATPIKQQTTSILQSVNYNPRASQEHATPQVQHIKENPEAVLKRYLGETAFSLVPVSNIPLGDNDSQPSRRNTQSSPATSPTELGSEPGSTHDVNWGNMADLAGLFMLSQSVESVGSVTTTENHHAHLAEPIVRVENVQGHSGTHDFATTDLETHEQQQPESLQVNMDCAKSVHLSWEHLDTATHSAASSSPAHAPFDFSQLPPSSPPVIPTNEDELAQAAFWLSSPLTSPVDFGTISEREISPLKKIMMMDDLSDGLGVPDGDEQAEALKLINQAL
ncbi:hypothetical protein QFC19_007638 [Naganishia cerealis]|uniref:Uncharacterized protein n=1 Tax=Naganishia cerealis TaxID=610337 RepID=A0ACC2V741_9TREE|nr:hypothetical protein QFC19_007638 [Naganishia cerealis]